MKRIYLVQVLFILFFIIPNVTVGQTKLDYVKSKLMLTFPKVNVTTLDNFVTQKSKLKNAIIYHKFKEFTVKEGNENNGVITLEGLATYNIEVMHYNPAMLNKTAPSTFNYKATLKQVLDDYEVESIELLVYGSKIKIY
ncbi:hypothetical protein ACFSRY_12245 [Pontibacter locisalis]|uniref:YceI-like domain-containing protein n=1 Tax=Pontibacter locisalis TaxID=1719035 RepID=A0ABW5INS7_9BACT